MKYIFSLLLVCSSYLSFGQMTVSDLIKIHSMNVDQFETYAIKKGFSFESIKINNEYKHESYVYLKGKGVNTRYLVLYTKYFDAGKNVLYQTSNSSEFLNIKKEIKKKEFTLINEEVNEGNLFRKYRNNKYEITLVNGKTKTENEIYFEINLNEY